MVDMTLNDLYAKVIKVIHFSNLVPIDSS